MKNIFIKTVLMAFVFSSMMGTAVARECTTCKKATTTKTAMQSKAAACKRAQSTAELNVNNVRALINGYGNMWYDGSISQYHIPKDANTTPMYCAALWIGGTDVNQQLRLAALRFGQEGDDYWPGPLTVDGAADISIEVCNYYDRHYKITQTEVQTFMQMFDYSKFPAERRDNYDESLIAQVIKEWPAHGNFANQSYYLAPFFDANGDHRYNYQDGDYPYYDFDNALCPRTLKASLKPGENYSPKPTMDDSAGIVKKGTGLLSDQVLKGDQTIWWVFNDMGNTHTESGGQPIGLEIRAQAFAFSTNDEINNMTFYSYEIINRSTYELRNTYFSQWVDPDLGYAKDDYVGCDVKRGLGYCYNGDEEDGPGTGQYSGIPPAVGIDFFQGPYMDPDGIDNPRIDISKMALYYPEKLAEYRLVNGGYDTIKLNDDADLYYPLAWYFQKDDSIGNCAINGVNFGNNIVDDERFGMRRFVYYNNSATADNGEPDKATDYYNYLQGIWRNGRPMTFGGNAINTGTSTIKCDFMFPDDSDPLLWGTNGVRPDDEFLPFGWNETSIAGNSPSDRRFMQSAGPFTLMPGAVNYITVGIPFAQATSGSAWTSVGLLREIDDVCQALFENCFKVLDGPDAPTLVVQEMDKEVILYITYENPSSNNYNEKYNEEDPSIVRTYIDNGKTVAYTKDQRSYKFEGYQIYQLANASASVADIGDETKARLVFQCDVENYYDAVSAIDTVAITENGVVTGYRYDTTYNDNPTIPIGKLVNYNTNSSTGILTGRIMVDGENSGIKHVVRITTDQFAKGNNTNLVNNKEYYYVCVAYAHNRYKEYSQTDPSKLDGQKEPYLAGRKNEKGGTISPVTAKPHDPSSENGGTIVNATFGMSPNITRIDGYGNGGNALRLTEESIQELMGAPGEPAKAPGEFTMVDGVQQMKNPCIITRPRYEQNYGPINVRVIDPLNIKQGTFYIKFNGVDNTSKWVIYKPDGSPLYYDSISGTSVFSDTADFVIGRYNEQLFLDLGIAVAITNPKAIATDLVYGTEDVSMGGLIADGTFISATMNFDDPSHQWLSGIPDNDNSIITNWIRSGSQYSEGNQQTFLSNTYLHSPVTGSEPYLDDDYYKVDIDPNYLDRVNYYGVDRYQAYEKVLMGLWSPYGLASYREYHPAFSFRYYLADQSIHDSLNDGREYNEIMHETLIYSKNKSLKYNDFTKLPSVRIVLTSDTSKWTRCPVLEMCDDYTQAEGNARRFQLRKHKSIDKNGDTCDATTPSTDPGSANYIDAYGMGWFPGYAINLVTGERLNIMYGEDSRYIQFNGRDMMWNPVSTYTYGTGNYVMGGRHYIYIMNAVKQKFSNINYNTVGSASNNRHFDYRSPSYDAGRWAVSMLKSLDHFFECPFTNPSARTAYYGNFNNGLLKADGSPKMLPMRDSAAFLFSTVAWVNMPLASEAINNPKDIPTNVTIDINVNNRYGKYLSNNETSVGSSNYNNPMYQFDLTSDIVTETGVATRADARQSYKDSIMDAINVVPNPYYSYSTYETLSQLETKVRFINVPGNTTINIYTVDGTLVRTIPNTPSNTTTVDWDLHNHNGIPIAGGMYLIHFSTPGIGEKIVKWFGTMRPVDLSRFQF